MKRTPEQDAAYCEARRIADRMYLNDYRGMDEEEFKRLYRATLHRHLIQALEPIRRQQIRLLALYPSPGLILHPDGRVESMPNPALKCDAYFELEKMADGIIARYIAGPEFGSESQSSLSPMKID